MCLNRCTIATAAAALLSFAVPAPQAPAQCTGYNMTVPPPQVMAGITDIGNHVDDGLTFVGLPFAVSIYGQTFTSAMVCSNGQMTMGTLGTTAYSNACLPSGAFPNVALAPFWEDLRTDGVGQGIFTATFGNAPSRTFIIEWRAGYYGGAYSGTADFAVIFHEGQTFIDFEYLNVSDGAGNAQSEGASSTVGVQASGSGPVSQMECNTGGLFNGEVIRFTCAPYLPPSCTLSLSPPGGYAGSSLTALCTVTPGSGPVSTGLAVSLNASAIGAGTITLHDDGVSPDAAAGDLIFSGTVAPSAATPPGTYTMTSTVSDSQARSSACAASYAVLAAPPPCSGYEVAMSQVQQLVPTFTDIGNHGDDVLTPFHLPFPVSLYGQTFTDAIVSSNGNVTMGSSGTSIYVNTCLPQGLFPSVTLLPFWDDLRTDGPGQGIFAATYGNAPFRAFVLEWRAGYFSGFSGTADFEIILYENNPYLDFVYGAVSDGPGPGQSEGASSTIGVQSSGSATQFGCNAGGMFNGEWLRFSCATYAPPTCALSLSPPQSAPLASFSAFCTVTPGSGPVSTGLAVSLDAGPVGGGTVTLHDDGLPPDLSANDHVFSGTITPSVGPGVYTLTSSVTDAQGRSSSCAANHTITPPRPPNDDCTNAIPAFLGDNLFDSRFATNSQGQICNIGQIDNDLWYTFTSPTAGTLTVMTCLGSTADTAISVYTDCGGCSLVSSDDSGCGVQSSVTFCAAPNATYLLRIGGFGASGWVGSFRISMAADAYSPPSGAIAEAEPHCAPSPDTVNGGCSGQPYNFSDAALCHSYHGVTANIYELYRDTDWYRFTMPASGTLHVTGQTDFPALFQVRGAACPAAPLYALSMPSGGLCGAATVDFTATLAGPAVYTLMIQPRSYQFAVPCNVSGNYWFSLASDTFACPDPACCRNDYNGDGDVGTDADIESFFACLAGSCCATCPPTADFNCDGDVGTDLDIESFFRVLAGGPC